MGALGPGGPGCDEVEVRVRLLAAKMAGVFYGSKTMLKVLQQALKSRPDDVHLLDLMLHFCYAMRGRNPEQETKWNESIDQCKERLRAAKQGA